GPSGFGLGNGCGVLRECENARIRAESSPAPVAAPARRTPFFSRSCRWMSYTPADARFMLKRTAGLVRRGWLSLRTRGVRSSLERLRAQFVPPSPALREGLYQPPATPFAPFSLASSDTP